jgi:hypothetical protein
MWWRLPNVTYNIISFLEEATKNHSTTAHSTLGNIYTHTHTHKYIVKHYTMKKYRGVDVYKHLVFLRSVRRLLVAACVVPSSPIFVTLMKEGPGSSETSVLTRATRRNNPEDTILLYKHSLTSAIVGGAQLHTPGEDPPSTLWIGGSISVKLNFINLYFCSLLQKVKLLERKVAAPV